MLRMYLLQIWFNLSDEGTEDAIYDSYAMRKFVGINFLEENVPDATTLLKFRRLLEQHGLNKLFFDAINRVMVETGHMLKGGTVVDATIINASPSTKNVERCGYNRDKKEPSHESSIKTEADMGRRRSAAPGKEKMMNPEEIGLNIRRYRLKCGLTQEQLAELADLSEGYIRQVEIGIKTLSLPALYRIAEALDTSAHALLASEADRASRVTSLLIECTSWEQAVIVDIIDAAAESLRRHHAA